MDSFCAHDQSLATPLATHTALLKDHALILGERLDQSYTLSGIDLLWAAKTNSQRVGWYCQIYNQYQQCFGGQASFGLSGEILSLAPEVRDRHLQVQLSAMREVDRFFELFYQTQVLSAELVNHTMLQQPQGFFLSMPNGLYPFVSASDHADTLFQLIVGNQLAYSTFRHWWQLLKKPANDQPAGAMTGQQRRFTLTVASQVLQKLATVYHHHLQQLQEQGCRQPSTLSLLGNTFCHSHWNHEENLKKQYDIPSWRNVSLRLTDFCTAYTDYAQEAMTAGVMERRHFLAMLANLQKNPYFSDHERKMLFGAVTDTTVTMQSEAKAKMAMRPQRPYPHGYGVASAGQKVAALRGQVGTPPTAASQPAHQHPTACPLTARRMVEGNFTDGAGLTLQ